MPKIDLDAIEPVERTGYPKPYSDAVQGRWQRKLAAPFGITDYGINHVTLKPGAWSSQRHWHEGEDEFVVVLAGHATLVDDSGRTPMGPGDCAAFPKNDGNGHHLINDSDGDCVFIAIGRGPPYANGYYPDIDMFSPGGTNSFVRKDGSSF